MRTPESLRQARSIAILGYGREGRAAIAYTVERLGVAPERLTVLDTGLYERPTDMDERITFVGGAGAFAELGGYDTLIKSPGIPPRALDERDYERATTVAQMFFDLHPERVIAVSGTKGKSTLATLLAQVIRDAGHTCGLYGNIGAPPLPAYDPTHPPEYVVIELSSYMLDQLDKRDFMSILVNIFPDHLDWHGSYEAYVAAKLRLLRWSSYALVGAQARDMGCLEVYHELYGDVPPHEVFGREGRYAYSDGWWTRDGERLFPSANMRLIGTHLYENFASVIAVADRIGISMESVRRTFEAFDGLPHRLRLVGELRGTEYWDDAISTTPESTMASMGAILESGRRIGSMLLGGLDRGYDYQALGEAVARAGVRRCVLFPDAWDAIKKHLPGSVETLSTGDMDEAVRWASETGDVCLLSTAAPSYSIWRNFEEKGERFIAAIARLPR